MGATIFHQDSGRRQWQGAERLRKGLAQALFVAWLTQMAQGSGMLRPFKSCEAP